MNVPLTELLSEAQGTGVAPKLRVTILHSCLDTGKHAERFTDQMAAGFADESGQHQSVASFQMTAQRHGNRARL